ncbi:hypothetical protein C7N43_01755 [Sphingobacteriales bacterium UPWRP_1]|nr:hypothetical protein B6N25_15100 [Sphingobacteriales bacterium TSM_CSS]PSJ78751.1 hypothetical protein C7N43_01755 [Sphingobacteriales bacterium UPWRP_1]
MKLQLSYKSLRKTGYLSNTGSTFCNFAHSAFVRKFQLVMFKQQPLTRLKLYCFIFFCTLLTPAFAQKETNNWYFGEFAGLDFNPGAPVALTNGALNTNEGCASISDAAGQLLFYTGGNRVFNRNHVQMPNGFGLMGDISSTQSAIIVPQPGSSTLYYIFTVDEEGGPNGLRYSMVDLNLQGGLGDVFVKNVPLVAPTSEKVTAVKHNNNFDVWVITHEWESDAFYAYLVTAAGVSAAPVVSNVGLVHTGGSIATNGNSAGYMKVSPLGNKLALAIKEMNLFEIFDFNSSTGVVSNAITTPATYTNAYGVEFSPDGTKLYASKYGFGGPQIFQFNLQAGSVAAILSSSTLVGTSSSLFGGGLQLGTDGKIYFARFESEWLGVINNPNTLGVACGYVDDGVNLNGKTSNFGLPNFVQSYLKPSPFTYQNTCFGATTQFAIINTAFISSVSWNFGDAASGASNTSTQLSPTHVYSAPGTYTVSLTTTLTNGVSETNTQNLLIHPLLTGVDLGADQTICATETLTLSAIIPNSLTYLWQDGSAAATFTVSTPGTYSVTVSGLCNSVSDAVTIAYNQAPNINLGGNQTLCNGQTAVLNAAPTNGAVGTVYQWETGETTPTYTVTTAGTYTVAIGNQCGSANASVTIDYLAPPVVELGADLAVCLGTPVALNATPLNALLTGPVTYQWQDGSATAIFTATSAGTYSVTVNNSCGTATDNITVTNNFPPVVDFGGNVALCPGETLILDATVPDGLYLWQDGSTAATFTISAPGNYWVEVTNLCGLVFEDITVSYTNLPDVDLGPDATLCPGQTLALNANTTGAAAYLWQDGSNNPTFTANAPGIYWVQIANSCSTQTDSITIEFGMDPTINLGADTTLCEGEAVLFNIAIPDAQATYLWSNGGTLPDFTANAAGTYWGSVTNQCGTVTDTVAVSITPLPAINLGNDVGLCPGESVVLDATVAAATAYNWSNGDNTATITVGTDGTYSVTVTTACGVVSDTVNVNLGTTLTISLGLNLQLCNSDSFTLDATTAGVTYQWQDGSSNATFTANTPGAYWVQIANSCSSATDTVTVNYLNTPFVQLAADTTLCPGETLFLNAQLPDASVSYLWNNGSTQPDFTVSEPGLYAVTLNNACGNASDSILVNYNQLPTVSAGPDVTICIGETATLAPTAANATAYLWQNGSTQPTLIAGESGVYAITVSNACGSASDAVTVTVNDCLPPPPPEPLPCTLLVPNAFSPNNDGVNDVFAPVYNCTSATASFSVFNRWGERVFTGNTLTDGWNGSLKNEPCPIGVYVWVLEYLNDEGQMEMVKGNVTLLR